MTSAPADPLIGQTLDGRYVLRSRIARGGMAVVYLASDLRLERRVAVKMMHDHLTDDENFTRRFEQEARSAARLSHPNVVNVFDQGHDAGRPYLVMEYLPGITLRDLLKQQQRLTGDQSLEIAEATLSGLAAAHRAGIVHRDLKPENVLLADDGRIKIGDFGLARAAGANTTTGQALLGTIAYLSPELVTRGIADARSDVYAFGIMLFEMLTGAQPFRGEQPMQIAYQHAHSDVPAPSTESSEATPELDELVRWTTQRDPDTRPRDAGVVLDQLHRIRDPDGAPLGATRVLPVNEFEEPGVTAATTVLGSGTAARPAPDLRESIAPAPGPDPSGPIDAAGTAADRRMRRGRLAALLVLVATAAIGATAWWFGQGPGARVTIPDVSGQEIAAVEQTFADLHIAPDFFECSSVDVAAGLAVSTDPEPGARVDRESTVRVCQSTGPEMLPVPTLVGLSESDAERAIADAGFTVGEVSEERFDDSDAGTVLAALDENGEGLGDAYAEQGVVDLVVSAGPLPNVGGMSIDDATATLTSAGLSADGPRGEAYSDDVDEGVVIRLLPQSETVRSGDAVGLEISLGPERFPVPDVSDADNVEDAMKILRDAGFEPKIKGLGAIPERLLGRLSFDRVDPEPGTELPKGSEVEIIIG